MRGRWREGRTRALKPAEHGVYIINMKNSSDPRAADGGDNKTPTPPKSGLRRLIGRRPFLKGAALLGTGAAVGGYWHLYAGSTRAKGRVVIIGGGAAGISVASRLARLAGNAKITLIDPSTRHFYQPGFTLIAAGVYVPDEVWRPQADCMPEGVNWLKDSVVAVDPDAKKVTTSGGNVISYDLLVLAPGLQLNWEKVEGLSQPLLGKGNVHSIYDFEGAQKTWPAIQEFVKAGGRGIFADTHTKHKCGGAPKKICLLAEHLARKVGNRANVKFDFFTSHKELYDVPYFTPRLEAIYRERSIRLSLNVRVTAVDMAAKKVHLARVETFRKERTDPASGKIATVDETVTTPFVESYEFLHLPPPQSAPDFVRDSGLGWTEGPLAAESWAMVDKVTLVHLKYPTIVGLGDVAGIPTSKTSAAIRKQAPVAVANLIALLEGRAPAAQYDGYAACPIITDYGHVLLCEFDYDKKPQSTFPFSLLDTSKEQRAAWWLKVYGLKPLYFLSLGA